MSKKAASVPVLEKLGAGRVLPTFSGGLRGVLCGKWICKEFSGLETRNAELEMPWNRRDVAGEKWS